MVCHVDSATKETFVFESLSVAGRFQVSARATGEESHPKQSKRDEKARALNFIVILIKLQRPIRA
jgi:hypothetical protein